MMQKLKTPPKRRASSYPFASSPSALVSMMASLFPCPTLSSKIDFVVSPLSEARTPYPKFNGSTSLAAKNFGTCKLCAVRNSHSPSFVPMASASREPMVPPYRVLITGSSKGIGYALAKEFLRAGDYVVICSRSNERVESAVQSLREEFGEQHVWGTKCDVREAEDVKNLVAFAQEKLKYIDIWINNAGSNAYSYKPLAEASDEDLIEVVTTNTLGLMICCREAIKIMANQPRGGHIFNIDGAGSDGRPLPGVLSLLKFAAYGATKRSVVHLTKSLQAELQMQDVKNVAVHNLSPGMVTTDLLMSGATTKQVKKTHVTFPRSSQEFFLCILDSIFALLEFLFCIYYFIPVLHDDMQVAEFLVPNIRSTIANGSMKPSYIRFLTGVKAYSQIFSRIAFGARRNRYLLED
ncbi:chlorophyll(ide) b reductase NOL, chloroplastic [Prosopis cineraria]|uniref:chlorophyll(ide) b reductase NOL, chloroplastic n=1 Tax=Prosopis cineraria TaxID=364024 RepID=UPI00240F4748|nr:chlorophyll(ide) b reductase NOL, chloroplastic [Prosopis cineraria]